jgi:hypothetical protein
MGTIRFVKMEPELFALLELPAHLHHDHEIARNEQAQRVVCAPPNFALAMFDGCDVMGAAGVMPVWPGRGIAWLYPSVHMGKRHYGHALARCERELRRMGDEGMHRIECTVRGAFPAGLRWAQRLHFTVEATMRHFAPNGEHHTLLARYHREANDVREEIAA